MASDLRRELLFGLVAHQNGLVNEDRLVESFQAWARDPSQSFGDYLEASGHLNPNRREAIAILVARELVRHRGSLEACLDAFTASRGLVERLTALT
ncbi:MAG TPA: hypothetical protein VFH33_02990 [Candidatus Krumholzibacteria bacterium]|nr:hypothetical protein [Candidatus Krumholzibacteria bacterium]